MPKGANLDHAHQVAAGKGNKTHGVYSMRDAPLAEWPEAKQLLVTEVADELKVPELLDEHERCRVAMGLVILQTLESYVAKEVAAGVPLEELKVLHRWPQFQNATLRGLKQVRARLDNSSDVLEAERKRIGKRIIVEDENDVTT